MYPLGDIGVALVGAFCLWAASKAQDRYLAKADTVWPRRGFYNYFFLAGLFLLILSLLDLVTFKGAIWQR